MSPLQAMIAFVEEACQEIGSVEYQAANEVLADLIDIEGPESLFRRCEPLKGLGIEELKDLLFRACDHLHHA